MKKFSTTAILSLMAMTAAGMISCSGSAAESSQQSPAPAARANGRPGGPQLGTPGGGPVIDKSADSVLQAMIRTEVPRFTRLVYTDQETGKTLHYSLLAPDGAGRDGRRYPLVLFMADASTPGTDVTRPLTQGYGALVWATPDWQRQHPCYVLVPQFSGVAVNDAYEHTPEVDMVMRLLRSVVADHFVDTSRLYTTGQSMGGMISMYYNVAYPDVFAASIFVDSHWDSATFPELVRHRFTFITAGKAGTFGPLESAARSQDIRYEYADWSARLPQAEQDSLAAALLAQGAPVNIINFTAGSVLPPDGKGSEHMYSFDYAYRLTPVREWLFRQSR